MAVGALLALAALSAGPRNPPDAMSGVLTGRTLRITVVHSLGAVDMGYDKDAATVRPFHEWNGFVIDLISRIAAEAGFSYTLQSPSGLGRSCSPVASAPTFAPVYAIQSECGADDVALGQSDLFWSMHYATPQRLVSTRFTVWPSISNHSCRPPSAELLACGGRLVTLRPFTPLAGAVHSGQRIGAHHAKPSTLPAGEMVGRLQPPRTP